MRDPRCGQKSDDEGSRSPFRSVTRSVNWHLHAGLTKRDIKKDEELMVYAPKPEAKAESSKDKSLKMCLEGDLKKGKGRTDNTEGKKPKKHTS